MSVCGGKGGAGIKQQISPVGEQSIKNKEMVTPVSQLCLPRKQ